MTFSLLMITLLGLAPTTYADHAAKPAATIAPHTAVKSSSEALCRCSAVMGKTIVKGFDVIGQGAAQGNGCVKWCVTKIRDSKNSFSASDAEKLCEDGKRGDLRARAQAGDGPWKEDRSGISLKNEKGKCVWVVPR